MISILLLFLLLCLVFGAFSPYGAYGWSPAGLLLFILLIMLLFGYR